MANIPVSARHDLIKIVELSGGSLDEDNYYYNGQLNVNDVTQEELEAGLATYMSDLDLYYLQPLRRYRSEKISRLAHDYIEQSYPSYRRELFIALAEEARNNGLTNRVAYIDQLLTWIKTVVSAVLLAEDAINSCDTAEEIESISLNTEVFSATDPKVTIRGAMAIEDTASDGPDFV